MTRNRSRLSFLFAACVLATASSPAGAAGLASIASVETLDAGGETLFSLGNLDVGTVALGIASPLSGLPNNFAEPDLVVETFFVDEVNDELIPITFNDESRADDNLDDATLGGLYRLGVAEPGEHLVGVSGFGPQDEGDYFFVVGEVDPLSPGGDFDDTDGDNETFGGADDLLLGLLGDGDSAIAVNTLADVPGGDVDFYRVFLEAGDVFVAMTAPLGDGFYSLDTVLLVFDADENFLFDDDDATGDFADIGPGVEQFVGPPRGFGSAVQFLAPETGEYFLAVTGFDVEQDDNIVPHEQVGDYALLAARVSVIPEPTAALLAAIAAAAVACRRR